jgi:hypothetical protein
VKQRRVDIPVYDTNPAASTAALSKAITDAARDGLDMLEVGAGGYCVACGVDIVGQVIPMTVAHPPKNTIRLQVVSHLCAKCAKKSEAKSEEAGERVTRIKWGFA